MAGTIKSKSTRETYKKLCRLLDTEKKVYYSRFGDSDIFIMLGRDVQNHKYHPDLQKEMIESFLIESPLYLKGLAINYPDEKGMYKGFMKRFTSNNEMENFLTQQFSFDQDMVYESAWFTQYYSIYKPREMNHFLDKYIRPKKKLFIGNIPQHELEKLFGTIDYYVQVPQRNAYKKIDQWWQEVLKVIDQVELVIPAAGQSTRIINKRLWKLGKEVHSIDIGSIVDAVSEKKTRRWIRLKGHVIHRILLPPYNKKSFGFRVKAFFKDIKFYLSCWFAELKYWIKQR